MIPSVRNLKMPSCFFGLLLILWFLCDMNVNSFTSISTSRLMRKAAAATRMTTTTTMTKSTIFYDNSLLASSSSDSNRSEGDDENTSLPPVPIENDEWRNDVLKALSNVIDPDLNQDIVTLGFIKNLKRNGRKISFDVELTTPACPIKEQFKQDCENLVKALPWTSSDVDVTMTAQENTPQGETLGLANVGSIIAVSSCKGGVGKSTTAVNLAYALKSLGGKVGIFDTDIYGPSLPTMVKPDNDMVQFVGRQIAPLEKDDVKLMSFGYVNDGSAIMRGPMITQLLDQFLSITQWGYLDYLILDMPPGTGDIQLTLTQRLNITAAVIVTTPQELSYVDVTRGIDMFNSVNVPSIAVVENMAYYEPTDSNPSKVQSKVIDTETIASIISSKLDEEKVTIKAATNGKVPSEKSIEDIAKEIAELVKEQYEKTTTTGGTTNREESEKIPIFGRGHKNRLSDQYGIDHTFSMPLLNQIAVNGDSGVPYILEYPDSKQADIYHDLAAAVVVEVAKLKFSGSGRPTISYDENKHIITVQNVNKNQDDNCDDGETESKEESINPATLRRECRCASCVEELTGKQILIPSSISDDIKPISMEPCGNYAISVNWSDGHRSLYPYRQINSIIEGRSSMEEGRSNMEEEREETAQKEKINA